MENENSEVMENERMPESSAYGKEIIEQNLENQVSNSPQENVENQVAPEPSSVKQSSPTYIELITERDENNQPLSVLEVDLYFSREKGLENRALKMNFAGIDMEKKQMVEKSVNINRENFEALKNFFCNLDWNS